jgi:hypothetical protein
LTGRLNSKICRTAQSDESEQSIPYFKLMLPYLPMACTLCTSIWQLVAHRQGREMSGMLLSE